MPSRVGRGLGGPLLRKFFLKSNFLVLCRLEYYTYKINFFFVLLKNAGGWGLSKIKLRGVCLREDTHKKVFFFSGRTNNVFPPYPDNFFFFPNFWAEFSPFIEKSVFLLSGQDGLPSLPS